MALHDILLIQEGSGPQNTERRLAFPTVAPSGPGLIGYDDTGVAATLSIPGESGGLDGLIGYGAGTSRPSAANANNGFLYFNTTANQLQRSNGSSWDTVADTTASLSGQFLRLASPDTVTATHDFRAGLTFSTAGTINVAAAVLTNFANGAVVNFDMVTGTAPFTVDSVTKVTNLNADLLDGFDASTSASSDTVAVRGTSGVLNVGTPTLSTHATTKSYVDNLVNGLRWKPPVRVATTTSGTLASDFENGDTVDGITLVTGDRILIKNQVDPIENGIYIVAASGAPARSADCAAGTSVVSASVFATQGTANADKGFVVTSDSGVFGTDANTWVTFTAAGSVYVAGNGLTESPPGTFNVGTASASRIVVNADNIDLATTGISAGTYPSVTVDVYGRATASGVVSAPSTPTSSGTQGQMAYDANFVYLCTSTNTWRRWAASTWS